MVPKITQVDTDQASQDIPLVNARDVEAPIVDPRTPLRPELRKAADASWERNEAAYRYLGR